MPLKTIDRKIYIQPHDIELFFGLFESRLMTLKHIAALYFNKSNDPEEAAKKRVQKLKRDGMIKELLRLPRDPGIIVLEKKGFDELLASKKKDLTRYPDLHWKSFVRRRHIKASRLRHELTVMNVKATLLPAIRALPGYEIDRFDTWPRLYQFIATGFDPLTRKDETRRIEADGFIKILIPSEGRAHRFFLEVDLTNEPRKILGPKPEFFFEYYKSGKFARWQTGLKEVAKEDYPFRVLIVVESQERRNNLAEYMLQHTSIKDFVMLTTFKLLQENPLGEIWISPQDYDRATRKTPFEVKQVSLTQWIYKRDIKRDEFVEQMIQKHRLL